MFCNCETYFLVYNSNMKVVIIGKGLMLSNMILGAVDSGAKIVGVLRYETTTSNRILQNLRDLFNPSYEYFRCGGLVLRESKTAIPDESFFQICGIRQ